VHAVCEDSTAKRQVFAYADQALHYAG